MSKRDSFRFQNDEEDYTNPLEKRYPDETDEEFEERMTDWYGDQ